MQVVLTIVGKDKVGITAKVTNALANMNINIININNAKYEKDMSPIDIGCDCPTCQNFSRAYIRHLFKSKEMLAMRLCVMHNLYFYNNLMKKIREAIDRDEFDRFKTQYVDILDTRI